MSVEETIKRCQSLRKEQRYREAFSAAQEAIKIDPTNADGWWQFGLNAHSIEDLPNALVGLRETIRLAPRFASGWAQYGRVLSRSGKVDEAEKAYSQALRIDPRDISNLRLIAEFYTEKKDAEGHLRILLRIDELGEANAEELNRVGILYHNKKNFGEALRYYHRSVATEPTTAALFNLGLVYSDREVSQDIDAVDSWRRALTIEPTYSRAQERLTAITPRLTQLAIDAVAVQTSLISREEWFQHYLNPFELLGVDRGTSLEELDARALQLLKKRLLQEIALENGRVSWLDDLPVDQSRAIGLLDEIADEQKKAHQWNVFQNEPLLRFLSRGDYRHFLYDETFLPLDTLAALEDEDGNLLEWLSAPFAHQYNAVLSRAIELGEISVIEALFDGRRWVLPEYDDICFEGAFRHAERILTPLRKLAESAQTTCPSLQNVSEALRQQKLSHIYNLLPAHFRLIQTKAVQHVRDIAIACHNAHSDSELSKAILQLSKEFAFKSVDLTHQLQEDFKKIEELIREQRKHEAKLTSGSITWEVTKEGVRQGQRFIAAKDASTIRWGILVSGYQNAPAYEFIMGFRDDARREILFSWKATQNLEEQEKLFNNLVQAALAYIAPTILEKITSALNAAGEVSIGTCKLRKEGVVFNTQGWIFSKTHVVPWSQVGTNLERGQLIVFDRAAPRTRTIMPLRDTENAIVLQFLSNTRD